MKQLLFLLLATFVVGILYSQPGYLDKTFGNNGFVADDGISVNNAIVQQKDGKLVTAGGYSDAKFNGKGNLARFLPDGTIDSSFGKNGYVFGSSSPYDMLIQADGKMLTVGSIYLPGNVSRNCVQRLKPDGTLDSSFGENGIALVPDFQDNYNPYTKIRQAPDGSLVITGAGLAADRQDRYSFISHISADGVFDAKFGGINGRVINHTALTNGGLAIQKDGRILLAGYSHPIYEENDHYPQAFVLSGYTPEGRPDESFGTNGTVITEGLPGIEGYDLPYSIVVLPDGKIIVGGKTLDYNVIADMIVMRYSTDGMLDKSFGTGGRAYVAFDGKSAGVSTVLLQPDDKLVLSGDVSDSQESDLALSRLNTDGSLDESFGEDGKQIIPFGGGDAGASCALLQFDGKIVQSGSYFNKEQNFSSYLLARYNNDSKGQPPLAIRIKRFLHNHGIGWQGLNNTVNYYSVQYSKTGNGFAEKGKVSGAGGSAFKTYDYNVAEAGYYRVVAVDRKGYKTFSNKILIGAEEVASAPSVYPNPARNYVTVQGLPNNETANISIKDGGGNVLARGVSSGSEQYRSALGSNMQPGTYYLNITTGNKTEILKFVKE